MPYSKGLLTGYLYINTFCTYLGLHSVLRSQLYLATLHPQTRQSCLILFCSLVMEIQASSKVLSPWRRHHHLFLIYPGLLAILGLLAQLLLGFSDENYSQLFVQVGLQDLLGDSLEFSFLSWQVVQPIYTTKYISDCDMILSGSFLRLSLTRWTKRFFHQS